MDDKFIFEKGKLKRKKSNTGIGSHMCKGNAQALPAPIPSFAELPSFSGIPCVDHNPAILVECGAFKISAGFH